MIKYTDDFDKYLEELKNTNIEEILIEAKVIDPENQNHNISKTTMVFALFKENNSYSMYIENFETHLGPYFELNRNKGYGNFLLRKLAIRLDDLGLGPKITKIYGKLITKDRNYWLISVPMYLKFAKSIFQGNPVIKFGDKKVPRLFIKRKIILSAKQNKEIMFFLLKK